MRRVRHIGVPRQLTDDGAERRFLERRLTEPRAHDRPRLIANAR